MREWNDKWNPFNSDKLMAHVHRWESLRNGYANPPILVTVDPINACNLKCPHCNSTKVRNNNVRLDSALNEPLAKFLAEWGVKAVCVAGGGEPLLNPGFIRATLDQGLSVGVVTNGVLIDNAIESLIRCNWVGVSVDAATAGTYHKHKGTNCFGQVLSGIAKLVNYRSNRGDTGRARGVFYKYLILPGNEHEIADAARLAKALGCKGFHARPADLPWTNLDDSAMQINVAVVERQSRWAMKLADETFGVYTVTHKFSPQLRRWNSFDRCWGCMMTLVITPHPDGFNMDLCCDRRGDEKLRLVKGVTDPHEIAQVWNSDKHWRIHNDIDPKQCPRCTYGPHSKLFEEVVLADNTSYDFI